jgi:hypothetical protein
MQRFALVLVGAALVGAVLSVGALMTSATPVSTEALATQRLLVLELSADDPCGESVRCVDITKPVR